MMDKERFHYWTHCEYEIISLQLTDNYDGLFSDTVDGNEVIEKVELDAIAVARCQEYQMRRLKTAPTSSKPEKQEVFKYTQIIGLYLSVDGDWEIADECSNYQGMKKRELAK